MEISAKKRTPVSSTTTSRVIRWCLLLLLTLLHRWLLLPLTLLHPWHISTLSRSLLLTRPCIGSSSLTTILVTPSSSYYTLSLQCLLNLLSRSRRYSNNQQCPVSLLKRRKKSKSRWKICWKRSTRSKLQQNHASMTRNAGWHSAPSSIPRKVACQ